MVSVWQEQLRPPPAPAPQNAEPTGLGVLSRSAGKAHHADYLPAAAALCLGFSAEAMAAGLRAVDQRDNPGRGQPTVHGGVRVFLDFGHNADGVRAVMQLVSRLRQAPHPRGRLTVVTGSAGDRTDRELAEVAAAICEGSPDRVLVRELPHYLRGRALGEVSAVLVRELRARGVADGAVSVTESEVVALRESLDAAAPGDFIAVLVHVDEQEISSFLADRAES